MSENGLRELRKKRRRREIFRGSVKANWPGRIFTYDTRGTFFTASFETGHFVRRMGTRQWETVTIRWNQAHQWSVTVHTDMLPGRTWHGRLSLCSDWAKSYMKARTLTRFASRWAARISELGESLSDRFFDYDVWY